MVNDASAIKSIGHPIRLQILTTIALRECSVKYIGECLGLDQCVVSHHLSVLKGRGIVAGRRRGVAMIYTIAHPLTQRIVAVLTQN
jgi:DNA-binding transcriptional ArsR family regulator